ncbi:MAG: exodeoxyribonuclease III [Bdellovibrionota bacterium]
MKEIKLASWNVNGLRSVHRKDFLKWFSEEKPDLCCLQEIKVSASDLEDDEALVHPDGFPSHWHFAEKPGYSGLVIYSKHEPISIRAGLGVYEFDKEGRWLEADFRTADFIPGTDGEFTLINSYWPNSQREHTRLPFKLEFCEAAHRRLNELRQAGKRVFICGDFNIAHKEIDLANPKSNQDNAGFLPEERGWMDKFTADGWVDTFRKFNQSNGNYTWWSYRPGVREKNIGWRLDYFFTNPEFADRVISAEHRCNVLGSDHCPVVLKIRG